MTTSPSITSSSNTSGHFKIVGYGICGPNEPYLKGTLEEFKRLCDETVIVLCNATKKEKDLIAQYSFHAVEDNREWGKHQWRIKEENLKEHVLPLDPSWVIALDMDEVFEKRFTREEANKLMVKGGAGYYFYLANMYNTGYSRDWSRWNVRMFKIDREYGLEYKRKPVHCGLAPETAYFFGNYAPFIVKHYGLKTKGARERRVERYKKYDPDAKHLHPGYYAFLASEAKVDVWDEDALHAELEAEVATHHFKNPRHKRPKIKYFLVKDKSGREIDVPENNLSETLKRGFTLIRELD